MATPDEWARLLELSGFQRHMKILVLGDGNMSFSVSLAHMLGKMVQPGLLIVTTFDSEEVLRRKYEDVENHLLFLRRHNWVRVVPSIDVRDITIGTFSGQQFDRVVFNFPYTGSEDETSNGDLLRRLFRNIRPILRFDAEVHLRLCNGQDETWKVIPLITSCGFRVVARLPFAMNEFPGYQRRKLESDVEWPMSNPITLISMLDERVEPPAEWLSVDFRSPRHFVAPEYERDSRSPRHYATPEYERGFARDPWHYGPPEYEIGPARSPRHHVPEYERGSVRSPWHLEYERGSAGSPRQYAPPMAEFASVPREHEREPTRSPRHYVPPVVNGIPRDYGSNSAHTYQESNSYRYVEIEDGRGSDDRWVGLEKRARGSSWDSLSRAPAVVRRPVVVKKQPSQTSLNIPNKKQKLVIAKQEKQIIIVD